MLKNENKSNQSILRTDEIGPQQPSNLLELVVKSIQKVTDFVPLYIILLVWAFVSIFW